MSSKIFFILIILALRSVSNAQSDQDILQLKILSSLETLVLGVLPDSPARDALLNQIKALRQEILYKPVTNCGVLTNEKQYYIQSVNGSASGRYILVSDSTQPKGGTLTSQLERASKFTVVQKSCSVYGFCADDLCMSRRNTVDNDEVVSFHVDNSDATWSQWTLTSPGGVVGESYNLKADSEYGYLAYKRLRGGTPVLTLNNTIIPESSFRFVEVGLGCGILENGQQYYLKDANNRYVVVKNLLAYLEQVEEANATKFTAVEKGCNIYGLCVDIGCMSRCEACPSDTGDFQTVRFHLQDANEPYSQWKLSNSTVGGPYTLSTDIGRVYYNTAPSTGALQLILDLQFELTFQFIKVN